MLTFRAGAAGARSAAQAMAGYLSQQTLPAAHQELAAYYTRGMGASDTVGDAVRDAARQVADGILSYEDAQADLMVRLHQEMAGPIDPVHRIPTLKVDAVEMEAIERRALDALTDLAVFYSEGGQDERHGTRPEPRADMHPGVAEALALDPTRPTTEAELANLFYGQRADGSALPGAARETAYIDLCWSADKSVSLAWAFAPTEAERASILQAHRDAVDAAMAYAAKEIGIARFGKGGTEKVAGHIAWVSFDHFTSRPTLELPVADQHTGVVATELHTVKAAPGDPNLHTHVAVPNVVVTEDGRVGSLHTARLRGRVHEFGAYYQAQLATRLRAIGADVVMDGKTGAARLVGISDRVRDAFSKRHQEAEKAARDFATSEGLDWDAMTDRQRVKLLAESSARLREAKTDALPDFDAWKQQAEALGWQHGGALRPERARALAERETRLERAYQAALPLVEAALARRSVISASDIRAAAARGLVAAGIEDDRDISRVTALFRQRGVTQEGRRTALIWGEDGEHGVRITTALHAEQEAEFVRLAREGAADRSGALGRWELARIAKGSGLDFSGQHGQAQYGGMMQLGTAGRVMGFIGAAGAGKTAILAPIVAGHHKHRREVWGISVAWKHADALTEAGIPQERVASMASFLAGVRGGKIKVGRDSVVVVDEVGMMGGRQGLDLLRLRAEHGFTLLMVGDDKQCQSVEAAPVIGMLREALGSDTIPEVQTTIRQQTEREREIAGLFRDGQAATALGMKRQDGTLEVVPGGYREAVQRVAELWEQRRQANAGRLGYTLTVSAPTNADARAISEAIRERRRAAGEVGADALQIKAQDQRGDRYDMTLAPGDRVRLFDRVFGKAPDGGTVRIGNNGTVVEVIRADTAGLTVRGLGGVATLRWDALRGKDGRGRVRLAYGDVLTIDAAQGSTATEHIVAMPAGSRAVDGFKGYTAASRHREATFIVTSDGQERQEVAQRRPLGDPRPITAEDVVENMARNLSRQEAKATATDFLGRARGIERGAARAMQAAMRPREASAAAGQPPPAIAPAVERHRGREAAGRLLDRLEGAMQARRDAALRRGLDAAQGRQRQR